MFSISFGNFKAKVPKKNKKIKLDLQFPSFFFFCFFHYNSRFIESEMEVSSFFKNSIVNSSDYKAIQPQNYHNGDNINNNEYIFNKEAVNETFNTLVAKTEKEYNSLVLTSKSENKVKKPAHEASKQEIYLKYMDFKSQVLKKFLEYDSFMESIMTEEEKPKINQNNNDTNKTPSKEESMGILKADDEDAVSKDEKAETGTIKNVTEEAKLKLVQVKRVSPVNLLEIYSIFTSIEVGFKSTKFSEYLKVQKKASANTRKWYRKYFKYFFIVDGILKYLDPKSKLPIEIMKDFEELMITKAYTPLETENASEQKETSVLPPGTTGKSQFSHEMFLSGTNLVGYSLFLPSVEKQHLIDFVQNLQQIAIEKYGADSVRSELPQAELDELYEFLHGSKKPEPLMKLSEYGTYNVNW